MRLVEVDQPLELDAANPGESRTDGLHISTVYGSLFQRLDPTRYRPQTEDERNPIYLAVGLAWEQWLERTLQAMGELVARPGELRSPEGIYYSPDLLVVNGCDRIGEIKVTWMTYKGAETLLLPKFDKYHAQAMIYCWWAGLTGARFYILHINGTGQGIREPLFKVTDVDYTAQELQENATRLINYAKHEGMLK
jgi:hypothetical protein